VFFRRRVGGNAVVEKGEKSERRAGRTGILESGCKDYSNNPKKLAKWGPKIKEQTGRRGRHDMWNGMKRALLVESELGERNRTGEVSPPRN